MLPPNLVIFTAVEGALLDPKSQSWSAASEALEEIERRRVPLVLVTSGTRAELEAFRTKIGHGHPFVTESGGGLFIPDGYFTRKLEGAVRVGRYFCVAFGRPYAEAIATAEELAQESGAAIVGYSQLSAREIARNTGEHAHQAELAKQREFSERFFFVGDSDAAEAKFELAARERGWNAIRGEPFWELRAGNDEARALRHFMRLVRESQHARLRSIAIGGSARDLPLLAAADQAIVLPQRGQGSNPELAARLPKATPADASGPAGWNDAVLKLFEET
jgi:mannosyl-3-phosphoglycerate phosphatase family protein